MTLISKPGLCWKLVHVQINWRSPSMTENYMWPKRHTALYKSCARSHVVSSSHTCILSHEWTNTPGADCIIIVCMWHYVADMILVCHCCVKILHASNWNSACVPTHTCQFKGMLRHPRGDILETSQTCSCISYDLRSNSGLAVSIRCCSLASLATSCVAQGMHVLCEGWHIRSHRDVNPGNLAWEQVTDVAWAHFTITTYEAGRRRYTKLTRNIPQ